MPYILNSEQERNEMLNAIGVRSLDELFAHLPEQIKLKKGLPLLEGLSEYQVHQKLRALAGENKSVSCLNHFLGAGYYDHYVPSVVRFILSQPQFLTAYTPYQAECSQGILQAIYEYQTYIGLLTGMDVSNASLLDGASSLAEAVLMAVRIAKRKKVLISPLLHPDYRQTLSTYLGTNGRDIHVLPMTEEGLIDIGALDYLLDGECACCVVQSPNFFGLIEHIPALIAKVKEKGALTVMAAEAEAGLEKPEATLRWLPAAATTTIPLVRVRLFTVVSSV